MMACVLYGVRDLRFDAAVPDPEPGVGDLVVCVARAGPCGSDLRVWRTGDVRSSFPVAPGHDAVGMLEGLLEGLPALVEVAAAGGAALLRLAVDPAA